MKYNEVSIQYTEDKSYSGVSLTFLPSLYCHLYYKNFILFISIYFIILSPAANAGSSSNAKKKSYSKRETKFKKRRKTENFPFLPFKL